MANNATTAKNKIIKRLPDIEKWAADGMTDKEIFTRLGIGKSSFYEYKASLPELSDALKKGREIWDEVSVEKAEAALTQIALGYSFDETTVERVNGEIVVTKVVTKHIQPNVTALIFTLKNRAPDRWKDKQVMDINDITDETKEAYRAAAMANKINKGG